MLRYLPSRLAVAAMLYATAVYADPPAEPITTLSKLTVQDTETGEYVVPNASTGTRTDTPIIDTPLDIQVVTQQVLEDQQVTRIDQALRNVSGVAFTGGGDTSFGNAFDAIVLRGFAADSHLRNGIRIDSAGGDTELFTQQMANVDSIEVLKGPAAILYGAVEPGGVVNIVTKQPQAMASYTVDGQLGSYGFNRATVNATGPVNDGATLLYRIDASYEDSSSIVDLGFNRALFIAPVIKLLAGAATQLTFEFEHKDASFNGNYAMAPLIQNSAGQFVPLFNNPHLNFGEQSPMRERTDAVGLNWSHDFNSQWSIRQQLYGNFAHATGSQVSADGLGPLDPNNPNSPPAFYRFATPFDNLDNTYASYLDLTGHFATGPVRHTLLFGGDWYRFNAKFALTTTTLTFGPDPSVDSIIGFFGPVHPGTPLGAAQPLIAGNGPLTSWGVNLQDQASLADKVYLLAGGRFQHFHNDNFVGPDFNSLTSTPFGGSKFTPRVGALWRPQTWLSLYGNYAYNWGPSSGDPLVTGGLAPPTSARQKEVGVKFEAFGGRLTSTLAAYDLTKTNIPNQDLQEPGFFYLTGEVRSQGLEFDLTGELRRGWNLILNFSDMNARVLINNDPSNPPGTQWSAAPRLIGNLWTTYELHPESDRGFIFGGGFNSQGSTPALNYSGVIAAQTSDYTRIGSYAILNAMGSYRFKAGGYRLTVQLNAANLLNKRYYSYVELTDPQPGSTYTYNNQTYGFDRRLFGDPRLIKASINVQF